MNRAGYDDRAAGLEAMLRQLGLTGINESDRGDLLCVPLPELSSDSINAVRLEPPGREEASGLFCTPGRGG